MARKRTKDDKQSLQRQPLYPIKATSALTKVPAGTIREYEYQGFLTPLRNHSNNYRLFSRQEINWILQVRKMINEQGFNFEGVRRLILLYPCWKINKCSKKVREQCIVFTGSTYPCWTYIEKKPCCSGQCHSCDVYLEVALHVPMKV